MRLAEEERGDQFSLRQLFFDLPDDAVLMLLGGSLKQDGFNAGKERCKALATAILNREIYYRAFAFAPRFLAGLRGLPEADRRDARALLWTNILGELSTLSGCEEIAVQIFDKAKQLLETEPALVRSDGPLARRC